MSAGKMWSVVALLLAAVSLVAAAPGTAGAGMEESGAEIITHEVAERDNLSLLAGYYYKDPRQWKRVFDRNSAMLTDPNLIVPGTLLKIETDPESQWDIPYGEFLSRIFD
jgi:nucleoid-associated protein YgaU